MILSLTHNFLGIYKIKVEYKTCIERNKIVQIQRNNYSWLYFVKSYKGRPEKDSFFRNWNSDTQMANEETST